jgi:hypothetical protein
MNLAVARWHVSCLLLSFFDLSPATPSTFKNFIFQHENGTPCAISLCERSEQC